MTTTGHADQDRLALAEVTCRLAHVDAEASALAERRAFPAMPDDRRALRLRELEADRSALQRRAHELAERVPNPETVPAPDGTLPAERRRTHLDGYLTRRREQLRRLGAKIDYLDAVLADKTASKELRRRARDARAAAANELDVLRRQPKDEELRPEDMCPDGVHLASSHGYVWTAAQPAWPCAAWPGQQRIFEELARVLGDIASRHRDHELIRWQLTLYCGHLVERTAHTSYATYSAANAALRRCEVCGVDPAFIVEEQALGPVAAAPPPAPRTSRPAARKNLERRAAKLEVDLAAVRAQLERDS